MKLRQMAYVRLNTRVLELVLIWMHFRSSINSTDGIFIRENV